jgi:hypothetical protein
MYTDASSNPVTALQMVDALLTPLQAGLAGGAFRPAPRYHYDTSVSLAAHERLQRQYAELLAVAGAAMKDMQAIVERQAREIARLKAQLAQR